MAGAGGPGPGHNMAAALWRRSALTTSRFMFPVEVAALLDMNIMDVFMQKTDRCLVVY